MAQKPSLHTSLTSELTLDSLVSGTRTWTRLVAGPVGVSGLATLFTLFGTTVLYRELPADQAGRLALILALLETILLLSFFGQLTMITRLHSHPEGPRYNWRKDLVGTLAISAPILVLAGWLAAALYQLTPAQAVLLTAAGLIQLPLSVAVYMLNANRHYLLSNLLLRLPNASLSIPASLMLLGVLRPGLSSALGLWVLPMAGALGLGLLLTARLLPIGVRTISLRERLSGSIFVASGLVAWLPEYGVIALAGLILAPEQIASYAAMAVFLRVFKFAGSIIAMVMTPELIRSDRSHYSRLAIGLGAAAALAGLAVAALAPPVARLIYSGRYQDGLTIIPILAAAGAIQLFTVLPRSHLAGQSSIPHYRNMVLAMLVTAAVGLALSIPLIRGAGLTGIALAVLVAQIARSGTQFAFWLLDRRASAEPDRAPDQPALDQSQPGSP